MTDSVRRAGMPWLSVYLTVDDAEEATQFYQKAFGFEEKARLPGADGRPVHVEMGWKEARIMFGPEGALDIKRRPPAMSGSPAPFFLYLYCDDVDALFEHAKEAGAKVDAEPQDMFWGDRVCTLVDPNGFIWSFAKHVQNFSTANIPLPTSFKFGTG